MLSVVNFQTKSFSFLFLNKESRRCLGIDSLIGSLHPKPPVGELKIKPTPYPLQVCAIGLALGGL
jgi:hypothetical protein